MTRRIVQPTVITEEQYDRWIRLRNLNRFRCHLCGHKFEIGDIYTVVYANGASFADFEGKTMGMTNPTVCQECDTGNDEEIIERWRQMHINVYAGPYWSFAQEG